MVEMPADTPRIRVLLDDARDTMDGAEDEKLHCDVTSYACVAESVRYACTFAAAWKYVEGRPGTRPRVVTFRLVFSSTSGYPLNVSTI